MGAPIRISTPDIALPSLGVGSSGRPRFSQRLKDNRAAAAAPSSQRHLAKALARQEQLQSFGVEKITDEDIERIITDPDQLKQFKSLLSDQEIINNFGIDDPDEMSAFRQSAAMTSYVRQRAAQSLKEDRDGTHELEATTKRNGFWGAVGDLVGTLVGEDRKTEGQPMFDAIAGVLTGLDKAEELERRVNVRADVWRQANGGATMEELNELHQDKSWLRRAGEFLAPPGTPLGKAFGVDETGMPDIRWGGMHPGDVAQAANITIPFISTNWVAAGVANDLHELGFGSDEGNKKYEEERSRLYQETGDWQSASLDAFRARDDVGTVVKEGIIAGSDPSLVWGASLAGVKMGVGGVKATRGIKHGLTNAMRFRPLEANDWLNLRDATRKKIESGKFWGEAGVARDSESFNTVAGRIADKNPELVAPREALDSHLYNIYDEPEKGYMTRAELDEYHKEVEKRVRRHQDEEYESSGFPIEAELEQRARKILDDGVLTEEDLAFVDDALGAVDEPSMFHDWYLKRRPGTEVERSKYPVNVVDDIPDDPAAAAGWIQDRAYEIKDAKRSDAKALEGMQKQIQRQDDAEKAFITSREEFVEQAMSDLLGGGDDAQRAKFWRDNADIRDDLVSETMSGQEFHIIRLGGPSTSEDILARVKPRTTVGRGRLGAPRRLLDPSSEINNYAEGSIDRSILEGKVLHGRLTDEGDAILSTIMAQFRSMGEWFGPVDLKGKSRMNRRRWYGGHRKENRYLFEIGEGKFEPYKDSAGNWVVDKDEGRLFGITPRRGQKGRSMYASDVFSIGHRRDEAGNILEYGRDRRNKYFAGLTDRQNDAIDMMQDYYDQMKHLADKEGLDLADLGDPIEGMAFISRRTKDAGEQLVNTWGKRGSPGFFKTRFFKTMKDGILEGKKYYDPTETAEMYGRAMYRMIADKRLEQWLLTHIEDEFIRGTDLATQRPEVAAMYKAKSAKFKAQKDNVSLLGQYIDGRVLTAAEKKAMKTAFPDLTDDLESLFKSGRTLNPDRLLRHFKKAVKGATDSEIKAAIVGTKGNRKTMDKKDVESVLRRLGVDLDKDYDKVEQIVAAGNKTAKDTHTATGRNIQKQMLEVVQDTEGDLKEAAVKRDAAKDSLRTLGPDEASVPNINAVVKGENAKRLADDLDKFLHDQGYPVVNFFSNLNDAIRLMKTGFDFGVFFIQGLPVLFRNPEIWGEAFGLSLRAFVDDGVRAKYVQNNIDDILDYVKHGGHIGSTEMTQTMERGGWFAKLPMVASDESTVLRKGLHRGAQALHKTSRRFQTQYDTFLDVARFEMYKAMRPTWTNHATKVNQLDDLADFINKTTGHTSTKALGMSTTQRQLEGAFFLFSPKYTRAVASLFLDTTKGGLRGREARTSVAHLMASQYALHTAVSAALGQEPNYIPGKGNWLKNNIPGVGNIGFGGKPNALINMGVDISKQIGQNPEGFMKWSLWSAETYEQNSVLKRLRYQTSPVTSNIINLITGVDPIGRRLPDWQDIWLDDAGNAEFDLKALKARLLTSGLEHLPFMVEALHESGPVGALGEGAGFQVYPERPYEERDALLNKLAKRELGISLDELRGRNDYQTQLSNLEAKYPELGAATQKARDSERQFRRNDERMQVRDERDAAIARLSQTWALASAEFQTLPGNHREFRRKFWDANKIYGEKMRTARQAHPQLYADMHAYYEGQGTSNEVQAATNAFMDRLFSSEAQDYFGNTNYAAIDSIKSDLLKTYGPDVMRNMERNFTLRMKERLGENADVITLSFIDSIQGLQPYWEAGKETMTDEEWSLWLAYDNSNSIVQESLKGSRQKINFKLMEKKVDKLRTRMQKLDPQIDEWLVMFYGKESINRENKLKLR